MTEKTNELEEELEAPETLAAWQIHAYPHYERGPWWYIFTGIAGGGLIVTAFVTNNFLLAAIVVMVGVILLIQGGSRPPIIDVEITSLGIKRGGMFLTYRSISRFWIVYDPPVKILYLSVPQSLFSSIHIPLDGQDPLALREILKTFVKEDLERDREPLSDVLSRLFKI